MNSLYLIWVSGCLGMPVIAAFLVYKESVLLLNNFQIILLRLLRGQNDEEVLDVCQLE